MPDLSDARALWALAATFYERFRADERGEITEKVVLITVFVILALTAGGIITAKVLAAVNDLKLQ